MKGCSTPGSRVVISKSDNPKRKYPWTLEMVREKDVWIGVNTSLTNKIVQEGFENRTINDFGPIESIQREIETKVKILAGGAGVPVQFLGFPEFMSNRATAENTMEPVALVSISEQRSWLGGFSELFDKAILLRNQLAATSSRRLETGRVAPNMRFVTSAQIERLTKKIY